MSSASKLKLTAAIGFKGWREGLAREQVQESAFDLDFIEVNPIHRAFGPMARELRFDVSEMAIVTALQAQAYGKKLLVLPVTIASRFQHQCLITRKSATPLKPADLAGRRIGVRAYTQTTGVWVRGILENDYGVPASAITWVTQEGAHVAEYANPAWVSEQDDPRSLPQMLHDGDIDAAILGNDLPDDPDLVPVIADAAATAKAWFAVHRVVPTNHVLVVRQDVAEANPDALRALWRCLLRAKPAQSGEVDFASIGIAQNRPPIEMLLEYCAQQALLPQSVKIDELYAPARKLLGDEIL